MPISKRTLLITVAVAAAVAAAVWGWQRLAAPPLLIDIASGNGRIEATEIDIAAKNQGRVAELLADEGDWVDAGQALAKMDTRTLQAQRRQAQARTEQLRDAMLSASALVAQRETERNFTASTLKRSTSLLEKGFITRAQFDQDRTAWLSAKAALRAAQAQVTEAQSAIAAAIAEVERVQVELDDSVLRSPCACRVLYRLAEPGEVVGAGGRVLIVLDLSDVYMSIYLPTSEATRVAIDAEARIVLDALPDTPIPAAVSFVSPQSQFTPRAVETRSEREKLMFRVKVNIDRRLLEKYKQVVKTGVPGVAYVRLDPNLDWPPELIPPADL